MKMNYAPVVISVYNREYHFKQCISSLQKCIGADKTTLYITSDGPANDSDVLVIKRIRDYILNLKGFKEVVPILPQENTKRRVIKETSDLVFNNHDRQIRSEDDNIFALDFLDFVNQGLDLYKDRSDIFAVTGYNSPVKMPPWYTYDAYLRKNYSAWGVGIWRDKWQKVNKTHEAVKELYLSNINEIKKEFPQIEKGLTHMYKTGHILGDLFLFLYMYDHKMYSVYPTITRAKNIGTDGSGLHTGGLYKRYAYQELIMAYKDFSLPQDLSYNEDLNKTIRDQFKETMYDKALNLMRGPVRKLGFKANRYDLENFFKDFTGKK